MRVEVHFIKPHILSLVAYEITSQGLAKKSFPFSVNEIMRHALNEIAAEKVKP